jgi:hypothetical protein
MDQFEDYTSVKALCNRGSPTAYSCEPVEVTPFLDSVRASKPGHPKAKRAKKEPKRKRGKGEV